MKRLSQKRRQHLRRHAWLAAKRRRLERAKRAARRTLAARGSSFDQIESKKWITAFRDGAHVRALILGGPRPVPALLSLTENYQPTVDFLRDLKAGLVSTWRPTSRRRRPGRRGAPQIFTNYWDFTQIKQISVPVALMIASEYDRIGKRGGSPPYAIDLEHWDPAVRAMLEAIGFLSLCGVTPRTSPIIQGSDWRVLRFESGQKADGQRVDDLLQELGVNTLLADPGMYEAIVEALANTRHHAYPERWNFREPHYPGWWMTGYVDQRDQSMLVVVYDRGISIPVALADPTNPWEHFAMWQRLMSRLLGRAPTWDDTSADGAAIAAAMRVGRSSTGLEFRGRGLATFESALAAFARGTLTIRSRSGEYIKHRGSKASYRTHGSPIDGTLITWHVSKQ